MTLSRTLVVGALLTLGLAGCAEPRKHLSPDFGVVVNQNRVAQIADPDARYPRDAVSDGARAGLAMKRYQTGTTIPPSDAGASDVYKSGSGAGASASGGPK